MKFLLDTNIVLYFLSGDKKLVELLDGIEVYMSFITVVELLSYPNIGKDEEEKIKKFLEDCTIISESESIRELTVSVRRNFNLKVPDAFIAATSLDRNLPLLSADKGFSKVENLLFIDYEI